MEELALYYVTIRSKIGDRRQLVFSATDFGHAEEQANPYLEGDEIIAIDKEYEA